MTTSCRRHAMLTAVTAAILLLTTAPQAHAASDSPARTAIGDKAAPVSTQDLDKAKAEIEALRAMPQDKRVDYLMTKRENSSPANYETRKAEGRARKAYIKSLPEGERQALKEQMKADRPLVREKMKAKWDAMTPEQREAVKAKRKAEFDALPEDVKAKIKQRHERMKGAHKNHDDQKDAR